MFRRPFVDADVQPGRGEIIGSESPRRIEHTCARIGVQRLRIGLLAASPVCPASYERTGVVPAKFSKKSRRGVRTMCARQLPIVSASGQQPTWARYPIWVDLLLRQRQNRPMCRGRACHDRTSSDHRRNLGFVLGTTSTAHLSLVVMLQCGRRWNCLNLIHYITLSAAQASTMLSMDHLNAKPLQSDRSVNAGRH